MHVFAWWRGCSWEGCLDPPPASSFRQNSSAASRQPRGCLWPRLRVFVSPRQLAQQPRPACGLSLCPPRPYAASRFRRIRSRRESTCYSCSPSASLPAPEAAWSELYQQSGMVRVLKGPLGTRVWAAWTGGGPSALPALDVAPSAGVFDLHGRNLAASFEVAFSFGFALQWLILTSAAPVLRVIAKSWCMHNGSEQIRRPCACAHNAAGASPALPPRVQHRKRNVRPGVSKAVSATFSAHC